MPPNVKQMAHVGESPWWVGTEHDNGQATFMGDKDTKAAEMLAASGANFRVQLARLRGEIKVEGKKKTCTVQDRYAIVREDNLAVLGMVTDRYQPVQGPEAFAFFDDVIGKQAWYHTAGVLGQGEKIWILARLPEEVKIAGSDLVENYLLLTTGHDGSTAFWVMFSPIRVVCQNTMNIALSIGEAGSKGYRLSHYQGIKGKMNVSDARQVLGMSKEFMSTFTEQAERLAQMPIKEDELTALLQRIFPIPQKLLLSEPIGVKPLALLPEPKPEDIAEDLRWQFVEADNKRQFVRTLVAEGKGNDHPDVAGTRWAAFNGVVEWADYLAGQARTRTDSLLFGSGQAMKQKAWNGLTADLPRPKGK